MQFSTFNLYNYHFKKSVSLFLEVRTAITVFLKTELYVVYIKAIANKGPKETAIDSTIIIVTITITIVPNVTRCWID